jgi:hypothetical protein
MWMYNDIIYKAKVLTRLCLICVLFPAVSIAQDLSFLTDSTHYLWPTDASPYISSTFGETRAAHFHAGLDIRTWGREGYQVFATRDGIIHRIAISPHGYGKVIFLKHNDESFSLYAHLNRFEDSLMAMADSIRMQDYSFLLDRNIEHKNIRVKQGDLIGYTGSTGVGPPHLHFELRTPDNEPFNPLLTNLGIADDIPPQFSGLAVEHLDPETYHVNDRETVRARQSGGVYDFGKIEANGPVGLAVNVSDRANRTPNVYAVYSLALVLEQDTLFHSKVDAFSYDNASQMFIDRVFPLLRQRRQGFQRLYLVNGNELSFYQTDSNRGVIDLPTGTHTLTIIAEDYNGNQSKAKLDLKVSNRIKPPSESITGIPAYPINGQIQDRNPVVKNAGFIQRTVQPKFLTEYTASAGPNPESVQFRPSPIYYSNGSTFKRAGKTLIPGERQFLHLPDQTIWVEFPEDALFDTLHVEMIVEYQNQYPVIRFEPEHIPLKRNAQLNVILPVTGNAIRPVGLYAYNTSRNNHLFHSAGLPGSLIRTNIRELQEFRLRYDMHPPYVGPPRLEKNLAGMYVVNLPVTDQMSGIDFLRSRITVNGKEGIIEFDPDKQKLTFYKPGFQPDTINRVEAWVYDGVGNLAHREFESVRPRN